MKIGIDVSSAINQRAGIGEYTRQLIRHLVALDKENSYHLFSFYGKDPAKYFAQFSECANVQVSSLKLPGRLFRLMLFSFYKSGLPLGFLLPDVDLFHSPDHVFPALAKLKTVVTIHDLAFLLFPENYTWINGTYLKSMVPASLKRAARIIVDSENTKKDLISLLSVSEEKIRVIPAGVDESFSPTIEPDKVAKAKHKYGITGDYILYVGTLEPRKNIGRLVEAYSRLESRRDLRLVIAGGKGWLYDELFKKVEELKIDESVSFLGYIPRKDLPALYSGAELFVYPSIYEGFGLPVLEAMACGTPVITSNVSSLPEVAGDAALLIDPNNVEELASAIEKLLSDSELRSELMNKGLERAKLFSWERTARETLAVYQEVGQEL